MAWGSVLAATQLVNITTEQFFSISASQHIALNPGEWASVEVAVDFPASPTDSAIVAIYPSEDGGATYANVPDQEYTVDKGLDPSRYPFRVTGYPGFRVGVRRSGTTDTLTNANLKVVKSGVNL
jgi:hypothetical protein